MGMGSREESLVLPCSGCPRRADSPVSEWTGNSQALPSTGSENLGLRVHKPVPSMGDDLFSHLATQQLGSLSVNLTPH